MNHTTPLDADAVALIAAAFGLGDVVDFEGPTGRGELGQIFRLTTTYGTWAVKQPFGPRSRGELDEDAALIAAARAAGVPTPALRVAAGGSAALDVGGSQVSVFEWVDLAEPDPSIDPTGVGAAVGALHRLDHPSGRGQHPWYRDPVGAARWDELAEALTAAGAPFAEDLRAHRDEFVALERLLADPHDVVTCHRDLFPENLRETFAGGVCVIDWDNHGAGGASQELAYVVACFAGARSDRAAALVDGYAAAGGPGRVHRPGDFTMLVAALGHINERACARWLAAPAGDPERDRMASLFGEWTADPLTRARIADLLDAVAG